jgi:hypothetical protein
MTERNPSRGIAPAPLYRVDQQSFLLQVYEIAADGAEFLIHEDWCLTEDIAEERAALLRISYGLEAL